MAKNSTSHLPGFSSQGCLGAVASAMCRIHGRSQIDMTYKTAMVMMATMVVASPAWAMSNPASDFCVAMDGKLVMAKPASGGDLGLCYLPGNNIVDEWTLFRMFDGKKPADRDNVFLPHRSQS